MARNVISLRDELRRDADQGGYDGVYVVWFESELDLPSRYQCSSTAECVLMIDEECNQRGYSYLDLEVECYDPAYGMSLIDTVKHSAINGAYIKIGDALVRFVLHDPECDLGPTMREGRMGEQSLEHNQT
jgi:hypothetical protein